MQYFSHCVAPLPVINDQSLNLEDQDYGPEAIFSEKKVTPKYGAIRCIDLQESPYNQPPSSVTTPLKARSHIPTRLNSWVGSLSVRICDRGLQQ